MKDFAQEMQNRVDYIRRVMQETGAKGVAFGNSGGKDCALVGILCKKATDNVLGVCMPCQSTVNFGSDLADAKALAEKFEIESLTVDLSGCKQALLDELDKLGEISPGASNNIAPRLRMTTLYALAQSRGYLVAGTGNRSEITMGYFTKHGDGGYDFDPISDLTVTEVYDFLSYLGAPENIIKKAPSAGLFEGQTDEKEMGVTYAAIDRYIMTGQGDPDEIQKIQSAIQRTAHKRKMPSTYR